ncbi:hypothetical protein SAMN02910298_02842 [Pseudobutyrivibrio sp. YE44]|uniref:DUF6465 family protein n=1 Tax=Pseudobutyrivibrio sp. YE44 TaxID=1520802 RepID=UPI0008834BE8|nr:DUF6465 family protein [Pseudobutyrivibrio sp. YE44]SDB55401.1 hypothetical protein SAMN02910298_02842 [Pseudobutyrivibrio sp. YE44]
MTNSKSNTSKPKFSATIQYQNLEFSEAECLSKAQAQCKKDYKNIEITDINIYIKPDEHRVYYVANGDKTGSVAL